MDVSPVKVALLLKAALEYGHGKDTITVELYLSITDLLGRSQWRESSQ